MFFQKLSLSFLLAFSSLSLMGESKEETMNLNQQRIRTLDQELKTNEQVESETLVHSRDYMFANWPKYSEEIQDVRRLDLEDQKKEKEIEQLKSPNGV